MIIITPTIAIAIYTPYSHGQQNRFKTALKPVCIDRIHVSKKVFEVDSVMMDGQ